MFPYPPRLKRLLLRARHALLPRKDSPDTRPQEPREIIPGVFVDDDSGDDLYIAE